jgi:hypothetical protein
VKELLAQTWSSPGSRDRKTSTKNNRDWRSLLGCLEGQSEAIIMFSCTDFVFFHEWHSSHNSYFTDIDNVFLQVFSASLCLLSWHRVCLHVLVPLQTWMPQNNEVGKQEDRLQWSRRKQESWWRKERGREKGRNQERS